MSIRVEEEEYNGDNDDDDDDDDDDDEGEEADTATTILRHAAINPSSSIRTRMTASIAVRC